MKHTTLLAIVAIVIAVASLVISHLLVEDLATEERNKMEVWAEAMHSLNTADENTDLNLVLKVIDENHTIPVIVTDGNGIVQMSRNVQVNGYDDKDSLRQMSVLARQWKAKGQTIAIALTPHDSLYVNYDESVMIKRLATYPYVQLAVVLIFVIIVIIALLTSKRAEQNKVWVGLSKETAHQLGTPISSMMAWTEVLKETYPTDTLIPEMENDVRRLQRIAERFSKIGSTPELAPTNLNDILGHVVNYMSRRTSSRVIIECLLPSEPVIIRMNASLFEWVIENLCKNAVDAMEGSGRITIEVHSDIRRIAIDVSDTGKGIMKKNLKTVFKPGFTTKKRGWGLGLSLARRIVEEYHNGKIYVLRSEVGAGTTFRVELRVE